MLQIENSARSLYELAEQSSVYVPVSNSPVKTPPYLSFDTGSPWHIGALQAVALESMTMPSRLKSTVGHRGTLQDLEEAVNSTGKRRIAKLELSIANPDVLLEKASKEIGHADKVGSTTSRGASEGDEAPLTEFDIDVFSKDYRLGWSRPKKRDHVFGRAEASRGAWNLAEEGEPRDRLGEGPVVQRCVTFDPAWAPSTGRRHYQ